MIVFRVARGVLAVLGFLGLLLFAAWHVLAFAMAAQYRREGGVTKRRGIWGI